MLHTTDWQPTTLAEAGFAPDLPDRLTDILRDGQAPNLHGVVVVRDGRLVFEHYGAGEDFKWGESLGSVTFGPETLHDVRSVTKSIVGLLYGIALSGGHVPAPNEPLLRHFPEYPDLSADAQHARLTVEHALTMTLGLEWNEEAPYTSAENSEIAMERAPDRNQYILERPMVNDPGKVWQYCGGATALLGHLIAKGTGESLPGFARRALFEPLGIDTFEWTTGTDGVAIAASGLRLTPRDLARIGQTVLGRGSWHGREVVPAEWLDAMLQPRVKTPFGNIDYGYHWFLRTVHDPEDPNTRPHPWVAAVGNGGQRLYIAPNLDLVITITAGNYDSDIQDTTPDTVVKDVILPSIER